MGIEERLERLEKQNRRMKLVGGSVLVVAAALIVMACASPAPKALEGEELIIRDSDGKRRATIGVTEDGSLLFFDDERGKRRAVLGVTKAGPILALFDEKLRSQFGFTKLDVMEAYGTHLFLSDEKGTVTFQAP